MKGLKNKKSRERGITLIALVITIIVLIILATVSISMVTGDNGIIKKAAKSVDEYNKKAEEEQKQLNDIYNMLNLNDYDYDTDNDNNNDYDNVTGGELKVMEHELKIVYWAQWYQDLYSSENAPRRLNHTTEQTIPVVDEETGQIDNRFQSFNSVLKQYIQGNGSKSGSIFGWDPGKYYTDPPQGMAGNSPYALEFKTTADEMIFYASDYIRISVDNLDGEGYVMSSLDGFMVGQNSPSYGYVYVDFGEGSTKLKKVKIETDGNIGPFIINKDSKIERVDDIPKKILFMGDSWTEGMVIEDGKRYMSYSNIIADRLGYACINNGIGGSGYNELDPLSDNYDKNIKFSYKDRLDEQLTTFTPDVIVINGGGNDVFRGNETEQIANKAGELYQKLADYRDKHSGCKVVIMGVEYFEGRNDYDAEIIDLNKALIEKAKEYNLPYIDYITGDTYGADGKKITEGKGPYITLDNKEEYIYKGDNTHPTEAGHKYLGNALAIEMEKALKSIK